jgi:uncharacterized protein (TIGR00725 family)
MVYVGVIGGSRCPPEVESVAEAVGREVADRGAALVCGGLGGVMEAASRGAASHGGLTIGILPGLERKSSNPYISVAIPTGLGEMRNALVVRASDGLIAIDGSYGTLSEIAFALQIGRPVVGLETWALKAPILRASNAAEAVEILFGEIAKGGAMEERHR